MRLLFSMASETLDDSGKHRSSTCLSGFFVAIDAGNGTRRILVSPFEFERTGMIEGEKGLPLLRSMAGLAAQVRLRIDSMRIGVARIAGAGGKMKLAQRIRRRARPGWRGKRCRKRRQRQRRSGFGNGRKRLVTLEACNLGMPPGQRKLCLRVAFEGKGRGLKTRLGMAQVALVIIRFGSEFSTVRFGMTLGAVPLSDLVYGFAALRLVALRAGQSCMLPYKWKSAARMGLAIKKRGLEIRRVVTGRTIRTRRTRCKLSLMRVIMAVPAKFMRDRALKIVFLVALRAGQDRVLPNQAKLCEAVIETPGGTIVFEAAGIVTPLAPAAEFQALKCTVVLIRVTTLAAAERQPFKKKRLLIRGGPRRCILDFHLAGA